VPATQLSEVVEEVVLGQVDGEAWRERGWSVEDGLEGEVGAPQRREGAASVGGWRARTARRPLQQRSEPIATARRRPRAIP